MYVCPTMIVAIDQIHLPVLELKILVSLVFSIAIVGTRHLLVPALCKNVLSACSTLIVMTRLTILKTMIPFGMIKGIADLI